MLKAVGPLDPYCSASTKCMHFPSNTKNFCKKKKPMLTAKQETAVNKDTQKGHLSFDFFFRVILPALFRLDNIFSPLYC